jgi:hypothetical protein
LSSATLVVTGRAGWSVHVNTLWASAPKPLMPPKGAIMNTQLIFSTVTLAFAVVGFGAAHAGTTVGNSSAAKGRPPLAMQCL